MSHAQKLIEVFATGLDIAPERVTEALKYGECAEWDSVAHMAMVTELEAAFDVMLDTEDIIALSCLAEARRILARHGVTV